MYEKASSVPSGKFFNISGVGLSDFFNPDIFFNFFPSFFTNPFASFCPVMLVPPIMSAKEKAPRSMGPGTLLLFLNPFILFIICVFVFLELANLTNTPGPP